MGWTGKLKRLLTGDAIHSIIKKGGVVGEVVFFSERAGYLIPGRKGRLRQTERQEMQRFKT